jgi:hypothetical protein
MQSLTSDEDPPTEVLTSPLPATESEVSPTVLDSELDTSQADEAHVHLDQHSSLPDVDDVRSARNANSNLDYIVDGEDEWLNLLEGKVPYCESVRVRLRSRSRGRVQGQNPNSDSKAPPSPPLLDMDDLLEMWPMDEHLEGTTGGNTQTSNVHYHFPDVLPPRDPPVSQHVAPPLHYINPYRLPELLHKHMLGAVVSKRSIVNDMVQNLPLSCQHQAQLVLEKVPNTAGMKPMSGSRPGVYIETLIKDKKDFYIGITERPLDRFHSHRCNGYCQMALWVFPSSLESASLEKALIERFKGNLHMQNVGSGGERASCGKPHFLYVVS